MVKYRKIPNRYLRIQKTRPTVGTRDKSGRMTGRKVVRGIGDTTRTLRLTKNIDIDGDKKPDFFAGQILGRTKRIKANKRARAHVRQI